MMYFNDPFYIGMHPFAAHETHYVYVTKDGLSQRTFGELVIVNGQSRPRSAHVNFDGVADMLRTFYDEYIKGPRDVEPGYWMPCSSRTRRCWRRRIRPSRNRAGSKPYLG